VSQYEYGQAAIAATIEVEQPRPGRAYERFTREGPLAMLPLEDNHYALIWTAGPARIGHLLQASDHAFIQELQRVFGYRLGYLRAVGRRDRFDLRLRRASTLVSGRCVLVGNAANTLHPVAGQGFNLALRDLGGLSDLVEAQDTDNLMNVLQRYPQLRQPDHDRTVALGHGLVQVFSTDNILQGHAAAAGLSLFELCPLAKHAFGWQAMGFTGGVNSLMRGVG
jgi:2-octaprenyl-6-methoxyphenol hydroxylase